MLCCSDIKLKSCSIENTFWFDILHVTPCFIYPSLWICTAWVNNDIHVGSLHRDLEVTQMCTIFTKDSIIPVPHQASLRLIVAVWIAKLSELDDSHHWLYRYEILIILPHICMALDKEQSRLTYILSQWIICGQNLRAKNLMGTAAYLIEFQKREKVKNIETLP